MVERWQRDPRVLWRTMGDGLIVLAPGRTECSAVSGPAGRLWEMLAEPLAVADIVERLPDAAGDRDQVSTQVEAAVRVLAEEGLLQRTAGKDATQAGG